MAGEARIRLLDGESGYEVFRFWLNALCEAFQALGADAQIISPDVEEALDSGDDAVTLGFNLIRRWTPRTAARRHVAWIVDPPPYHAVLFDHERTRLPVQPERCVAGCADRSWVSFAREVYGYRGLFFLPHGCALSESAAPQGSGRDLDTVFLGSFENPELILERIQKEAGGNAALLNRLIEEISDAPIEVPLDQAVLNFVRVLGLPSEKSRLFFNVFYPLLDRYFRNRDRMRLMASMPERTLHVFGRGDWKSLPWPASVVIHGEVSYAEALAVMRRARVVVNHAPSHRAGGHERLLDALMCGAAVVTTVSSFTAQVFPAGHGVRMLSAREKLGRAVGDALSEAYGADAVRAGQAVVAGGHLMRHRAAQLLELVKNWA